MYKLILIPVDGSESSRQALEEGLLLAAEQRASVRLVHVWESMGHVVIEGTLDLDQALQEQGKLVLWEAAERASAYGVKVTKTLVDAADRRVAAAIVDEAESAGADLIAMGTHGRRGFEKLLLGSVAEGVARRANVPVLLIRKSGSGPLST